MTWTTRGSLPADEALMQSNHTLIYALIALAIVCAVVLFVFNRGAV